YVHRAVAVHRQCPRTVQAPGRLAGPAPTTERYAIGRKLLHAMVAVFHYVQLTAGVEGHVVGVRKLPRSFTRLAPVAHQVSVACEHLHAVVAGIRDVQQAVRPKGQRPRPRELPRLAAGTAPARDELTVPVKLADPLIFAELGDVEK